MIQFKIVWKWLLIFSLGFVFSTIIGTQTHELGHIAVAESLSYETTLSYGSMSYNPNGFSADENVKAWRKMFEEIGSYDNFTNEQKERADVLLNKIKTKFPSDRLESFYITIGGPAQTILTCFLGLFIIAYRKQNTQENFKIIDWISIFLSLFILREVFNTVMAGASYLINGTNSFRGDEFRISIYLGLNQWTIPILTALLGTIIASFVIFMIVPLRYRFTFILSGFVGSSIGFILWFNYLGPWVFA